MLASFRIFAFLFWIQGLASAQNIDEVVRLPIQFEQYMEGYALINPASICTQAKVEGNAGFQLVHLGGIPTTSRVYYFNANVQLNNWNNEANIKKRYRRRESYHTIGINIISDNEPPYIHRTRFNGLYAFHLQMAEKAMLSAGLGIGFYNYAVNYDQLSGSDITLDGMFGLWLYHDHYYIGVSINQIVPGGRSQPLEEVSLFPRHYNLTGGLKVNINYWLTLKPSFLLRIAPKALPKPDIDVALLVVAKELISIGGIYRHQKAFVLVMGIERIPVGQDNGRLRFTFSYRFPFKGFSNLENHQ